MSENEVDYERYNEDPRAVCKYGTKCYQKNPAHHEKYKHPPKRKNNGAANPPLKKLKVETSNKDIKEVVTRCDISDSDYSIDDSSDNSDIKTKTVDSNETVSDDDKKQQNKEVKISNDVSDSDNSNSGSITCSKETETDIKESDIKPRAEEKASSPILNIRQFIKEKFLVYMPEDFYKFWDFCKNSKPNNPTQALKDIGLILVGPYDVLAGKFINVNKTDKEYLIHWRYYHDPPEFQTVLKGDDKSGYHIGYFRDSPEELPVFLASNSANKNGVLQQMGANIFAAVNIYLEDLKKSGDPFRKMHIGRIQTSIKKEAERLKIDLSLKTDSMVSREKKIVTRTFNKIGLVVPYNKKTQQGYRELALDNKQLAHLLTKLENTNDEKQKANYLSQLEPVFTYTSIATDECDFGTGIELGWNIIAHGVSSLDSTALRFLSINYGLLNRETFAKIAEAHLTNRKKGCRLSII